MPSGAFQVKRVFSTSCRSPKDLDSARNLFMANGESSNDGFLDRLLADIAREKSERWEFDFNLGQPIPSSSRSQLEYTVLSNDKVPQFYRPVEFPFQSSSDESSDSENFDPVFKKSLVFEKFQKNKRPAGLQTPRKQPSGLETPHKQQPITSYICRRKHTKQAAPISKPLKQLNQRANRRFSLQP
ncbi:unnamed protein product [Bursaphelenchus xylophilus]|uniref:(pine wood nematode) hypothetical protein n=1 Tax=Bursaphelenchus xylophilus TaxID=6326 RepID=A0A1I7SSA0_BURXY|nr:unnamed protein product [Bursaphelenchus xylophilus]CAG9097845.1 unnamed protein product [Bursaphelenchus xylophilus]